MENAYSSFEEIEGILSNIEQMDNHLIQNSKEIAIRCDHFKSKDETEKKAILDLIKTQFLESQACIDQLEYEREEYRSLADSLSKRLIELENLQFEQADKLRQHFEDIHESRLKEEISTRERTIIEYMKKEDFHLKLIDKMEEKNSLLEAELKKTIILLAQANQELTEEILLKTTIEAELAILQESQSKQNNIARNLDTLGGLRATKGSTGSYFTGELITLNESRRIPGDTYASKFISIDDSSDLMLSQLDRRTEEYLKVTSSLVHDLKQSTGYINTKKYDRVLDEITELGRGMQETIAIAKLKRSKGKYSFERNTSNNASKDHSKTTEGRNNSQINKSDSLLKKPFEVTKESCNSTFLGNKKLGGEQLKRIIKNKKLFEFEPSKSNKRIRQLASDLRFRTFDRGSRNSSKERSAQNMKGNKSSVRLLTPEREIVTTTRSRSRVKKGNIGVKVSTACKINLSDSECAPPLIKIAANIVLNPSGMTETTFDKVYDQGSTQEDVFEDIKSYLKKIPKGRDLTILSIGPAQSGKTLLLQGERSSPGLLPRIIDHLFSTLKTNKKKSKSVCCSLVAFKDNEMHDLLLPFNSLSFVDAGIGLMAAKAGSIEFANKLIRSGLNIKRKSLAEKGKDYHVGYIFSLVKFGDDSKNKIMGKVSLWELSSSNRYVSVSKTPEPPLKSRLGILRLLDPLYSRSSVRTLSTIIPPSIFVDILLTKADMMFFFNFNDQSEVAPALNQPYLDVAKKIKIEVESSPVNTPMKRSLTPARSAKRKTREKNLSDLKKNLK